MLYKRVTLRLRPGILRINFRFGQVPPSGGGGGPQRGCLPAVIWRLLCYINIMRMAFFNTGIGDLYKFRLL